MSSSTGIISSVTAPISTAFNFCWNASKVYDIGKTGINTLETLMHPRLPTNIKIVQVAAGGTFIAARIGELTGNSPMVLSAINVVATVANIGRTVIHDFLCGRSIDDSTPKVQAIMLSGLGEMLWNLSSIPSIPCSTVIKTVGIVLTFTGWFSPTSNMNAEHRRRLNQHLLNA